MEQGASDAPTNLVATAGDGEATIAFDPPANPGGSAITGYTVTKIPPILGDIGTIYPASSPITVTGLTNGQSYTFKIQALNDQGSSPESAASNSVTPLASQTITFANPGTKNFGTTPTLTASSDSNLPVTFTSSTTGVCTITSGGQLTFISSGSCTINADQAGNGSYLPAPQVSRSFTVNAVVPGAPTNALATAGDTQASVAFDAPASNGGSTITGYTVTVYPPVVAPVNGASSPILVTGLTNGETYYFFVTAENVAGPGPDSLASNSVIPKAAQAITFANPGTKNFGTSPILTASSDSNLTVTFSSSTSGVCTITSGGQLTFITTGTCTINADQAGNGSYLPAPRVSRSFTVSAVVPSAPLNVVATAGDTQVSVAFDAPTSNGGSTITSYTVTVSPADVAPVNGASSPIVVTGLTNGQAYTFTVVAENVAGPGPASLASNSVTPSASQTITFGNPGPQSVGTTLTLSASATSSLSPTFTSLTQDICSFTPSGLYMNQRGTCSIQADQAGNAAYLPATAVIQSFQVTGAYVGLTLTSDQPTFIAGQPVRLNAEIGTCCSSNYNGSFTFYDGTTVIATGNTNAANNAAGWVSFPAGATPSLTVTYSGDSQNEPTTSNTLVLAEATGGVTEDLTQNLARSRMRQLFLGQPDLMAFLRGSPQGSLDVTISGKNGSIDWSSSRGPVWFRLSGSQSDDATGSSHYMLLSLGSHRQIGSEAILGVMGQIDSIGYSDATGSADGTGWLAGPYLVSRLGHLPLWVEGRLLWGQSRNQIAVEGQPAEDITGDRFLGLVKLSGEFGKDDLSLRPWLSYGRGTESFDLFTTSQGIPILGTTQARTEASLGLDFTAALATTTGSLQLDGGFGLVRVTEDDGGQNGTTFRLRLGLDHVSDRGLRSHLHLIGQGGGSLDARTIGADLGVELTF